MLSTLALLAACTTTPPVDDGTPRPARPLPPGRDGPGASPPANLERVPDAEPRIEPIRPGGANKPYEVSGQVYVPIREDKAFTERGLASWYGRKFHGKRTASGEAYDMYAMTAAHPTLPLPSYVRVGNPKNGREVVVRVNDRGPFSPGRIIDLSYTAALKLDLLHGVGKVEVTRITFDEIRTGAWRKTPSPPTMPGDAPATALAQAAPVVLPPAATSASAPASAGPSRPVDTDPVLIPVASIDVSAAPPVALAATQAATPPASEPPVPNPAPVLIDAQRGFWVQLGAFRERSGADGFHRKVIADLEWLVPLLAVMGDGRVYRLQAGPYASRDEAKGIADRVREALRLVPVIVERR